MFTKRQNKKANSRKKRKKIPLFYKLNFLILMVASLLLFYFLILVSIKPKSVPLITAKIESVLQKKLGTKVDLDQSYVSFTNYGTLRVTATSLKVFDNSSDSSKQQAYIIPRLEAEFSLLKMFFLNFVPRKIKVTNPTIIVEELRKFKKPFDENSKDLHPLIKILASIRQGSLPIRNIEIENAIILAKGQNFDTEILLKKSQISAYNEGGSLVISSVNLLNFDSEQSDVDFNSSCILSKNNDLKCDVILKNFVANYISDLHPSLNILSRINAQLSASASFVIKDGKMGEILFNSEAKNGSFHLPHFFSKRIDFTDLLVSGKYDNNLDILDLSKIQANLFSGKKILQQTKSSNPYLEMSLSVSEVKNPKNQKLDFNIGLKNTPLNKLENFWPLTLKQAGIRSWVISHISDGVLSKAYAKFSLQQSDSHFFLTDIDSKVEFSGANLHYNSEFPIIKDLSGIASFDKVGMKILINSGEVLNSKISEGLVEIAEFAAPIPLLKISGKSQGHASDSLKHVDHKSSKFVEIVEEYFNGDSKNNFDIRLPLSDKIHLKNAYIKVDSSIANLQNSYLKGALEISSKKDFSSVDFVTKLDLTNASFDVDFLNISKKSKIDSSLSLVVSVKNSQNIHLKNIELSKNSPRDFQKMSAEMSFQTSPFFLTSLNIDSGNFGDNRYDLSYSANRKKSKQTLSLKGQKLNLAAFLNNKISAKTSQNNNFANRNIQIILGEVELLKDKSMSSFYASLFCKKSFCSEGVARANYGESKMINLRLSKDQTENFANLSGRINDIGYLAEAFGISNTVFGGNASIKMKNNLIDKNQVLSGDIIIDNEITIFENPTVKILAKNDLFSQIQDKIFSNKKTIFNFVKIEAEIKEGVLGLKSLIANNFKIGITAKGSIDLAAQSYSIKGMIIPGFIVNNLFGIGKIPILGNVVGILTGGEGGGLFGVRYEYTKNPNEEAIFKTNKVSSFVPTTINSLLDLI